MGIYIESINFQNGDRDLNNLIQITLKDINELNLILNMILKEIQSMKKTISKDETGAASKYKLEATVTFIVEKDDFIKKFKFFETFTMDRISDDFDSREYEETIKKNFANKFTNDLILKISQIK